MDRLSAEQRAQLLKDDQTYFIGQPFSLEKDNARCIQAHARHLALMLLDTGVKERASLAAGYAEQLLDETLNKYVSGPVACAKGCDLCCRTYVSATIPEVLRMASAVRGQAVKTARVNDAAAKSKAMPQLHREIAKLDCPMLEDRACSEYTVRPLVCRAVMSKSLESCVRLFQQGAQEKFPAADNTGTIRVYAVLILRTALILSRLSHFHYEVNHALSIALADPDAEARWLAGEHIFQPVAIDQADLKPSTLATLAGQMAAALKPTI